MGMTNKKHNQYGGIYQLADGESHNLEVAGSSPAPATIKTQEQAYIDYSFK